MNLFKKYAQITWNNNFGGSKDYTGSNATDNNVILNKGNNGRKEGNVVQDYGTNRQSGQKDNEGFNLNSTQNKAVVNTQNQLAPRYENKEQPNNWTGGTAGAIIHNQNNTNNSTYNNNSSVNDFSKKDSHDTHNTNTGVVYGGMGGSGSTSTFNGGTNNNYVSSGQGGKSILDKSTINQSITGDTGDAKSTEKNTQPTEKTEKYRVDAKGNEIKPSVTKKQKDDYQKLFDEKTKGLKSDPNSKEYKEAQDWLNNVHKKKTTVRTRTVGVAGGETSTNTNSNKNKINAPNKGNQVIKNY